MLLKSSAIYLVTLISLIARKTYGTINHCIHSQEPHSFNFWATVLKIINFWKFFHFTLIGACIEFEGKNSDNLIKVVNRY